MLPPEERSVFEASPGPVVAVGDAGFIEYANPLALQLLGWDQDLLGRPLVSIIPQRLQARHQLGFGRYVKSGESNLAGKTVRVPARRRDGAEVELDLTIRVFQRPDGTKLVSAALSTAALGKPPPHLVMIEDAFARRMYQLV